MAASSLEVQPSRAKALLVFLAASLICPTLGFADAIYLKEKKVLKGAIVEDHQDRYILSTVDGEIPVLKVLIESVKFDDPEQSFYQLGREFQRAGRLKEALNAYDQAVKIRPDFKEAREAAFNVQRLIWGSEDSELKHEISHRKFILERSGRPTDSKPATIPTPENLEDVFGLGLAYESGLTTVISVKPKSSAYVVGVKPGDRIVAVWGELIEGLGPEQVSKQFSLSKNDLTLTIERVVDFQRAILADRNSWGFEMVMEYGGLSIGQVVEGSPAFERFRAGDFITEINGQPTRYLTLKQAITVLSKPPSAKITIRRQLTLAANEYHPYK